MIGINNSLGLPIGVIDTRDSHHIVLTARQMDNSSAAGTIVLDGIQIATTGGRGDTIFKLNRSDLSLITSTGVDTYGTTSCAGVISALQAATADELIIILSQDATSNVAGVNTELNKMGGASLSQTWSAVRRTILFMGIRNATTGTAIYGSATGSGGVSTWSGTLLKTGLLGLQNYNGNYIGYDENGNPKQYNSAYTYFGY